MSQEVQIALIAAGSALLGAVAGGIGGIATERTRAREARRERADERLLDSITAFTTALVEWLVAMKVIPPAGTPAYTAHADDSATLAEAVRSAVHRLQLLAPEEIADWIWETYRGLSARAAEAIEAHREGGPLEAAQDAVDEIRSAYEEAIPMFRRAVSPLR